MQINDACILFVKFIWYHMHKVKSHQPVVVVIIVLNDVNLNMEYNHSNFLFNIFSIFNANKSFIVNDIISLCKPLVHHGQGLVVRKEDNAIHQINLYPCIIHHNQLLLTKFGRIRHLNNQDLAIITFACDTGCNTRAKIWCTT